MKSGAPIGKALFMFAICNLLSVCLPIDKTIYWCFFRQVILIIAFCMQGKLLLLLSDPESKEKLVWLQVMKLNREQLIEVFDLAHFGDDDDYENLPRYIELVRVYEE